MAGTGEIVAPFDPYALGDPSDPTIGVPAPPLPAPPVGIAPALLAPAPAGEPDQSSLAPLPSPGVGGVPGAADATPASAGPAIDLAQPQPLQPGIGIPAVSLDAALPPPPPGPPPPLDQSLAGPPPLEYYAGLPPPPPPGLPEWSPDLAPPLEGAAPPLVETGHGSPAEVGDDSWLRDHAPEAFAPEAPPPPQPFDLAAPEPFAGLTDQQAFDAVERLSPEELLRLEATRNSRKALELEVRQHQIAEEDLRKLKENAEVRRQADERTRAEEDRVNADARALGQAHLDRGRWFRDASVIQKIGAIVGTLVGGLASKPGEPNAGVKFLTDIIDGDIADQKYDLENKRNDIQYRSGAVAREYQRTGDLYRSTEAVRLATYNALIGQLQTDQQNFDPRGTAFLEYGKQIEAFRARVSAGQEAQRVARRNEHEKDIRLSLDAQKLIDERRAHDQANLLGRQQLASAAADRNEAREARAADKAAEAADKAAERIRQYSIGGVPVVQLGPDNTPVIGADGKPVIKYDYLRNADNSIWLAESPEATRELRQKKTAAEEAVSIIDEIRAIRGRVGGESSLLNSEESQRLKVLKAKSRIITKEGTQGMSSDEDGRLLAAAAGTGDADSWRDQDAALVEARARTVSHLNRSLANAKYSGPPITIPESTPTKNTADEDELQSLLVPPSTSFDDEVGAELTKRQIAAGREGSLDITNNPEDQALYRGAYQAARASYDPEVSRDQRRKLAELEAAAVGVSPGALAAAAKLQTVATTAGTGRLRELARQALQAAQSASLPGTPEVVGPDVSVSHETVPPLPRRSR